MIGRCLIKQEIQNVLETFEDIDMVIVIIIQ